MIIAPVAPGGSDQGTYTKYSSNDQQNHRRPWVGAKSTWQAYCWRCWGKCLCVLLWCVFHNELVTSLIRWVNSAKNSWEFIYNLLEYCKPENSKRLTASVKLQAEYFRPSAKDLSLKCVTLKIKILPSRTHKPGHAGKLTTLYNVQAQLYTVLELCRTFDRIFKEHLDGRWAVFSRGICFTAY